MTGKEKDLLSEATADMTPEQREKLQEKLNEMTPMELAAFRNSCDPDSMGFLGEESV